MQSPFKFFRRHQKAFLAFLALGAMIAFGVGDVVTKMTGPGLRATGETLVATSAGNLTERDMLRLRANRRTANEFMYRASEAAFPEMKGIRFAPRTFGPDAPQEVLYAWLLRQEADRLGIRIDDEHIDDFLDQTFAKKLSTVGFRDVLKRMRISQFDLYAILRDQLLAEIAHKVLSPRVAATPEQYWNYYQQLHTRQKIEVAALPVSEFHHLVEEPSDAELRGFFEQHKDAAEDSRDGEFRPGFRQPRRVQLQYLALDYDRAEEQALAENPITDKEIEDYYEEKKHIDLRFQEREPRPAADGQPLEPQFAPDEPGTSDQRRLPPPGQPGEQQPEPSAPPRGDDSPPVKENDQDPGASASPREPAEPPCGQETDEPADARQPSGSDAPAEETPSQPSADANDEPSNDDPGAASGDEETQNSSDQPEADGKAARPRRSQPKIRFKPLDDDLKDMIRESLAQQRAAERLKNLSAEASKAMYEAGLKLGQKLPEIKPNTQPDQIDRIHQGLAPEAAEALKGIADRLGLKYGETALVSVSELRDDPVLGKTREATAAEQFLQEPAEVAALVFRDQNLYGAFELEDRRGFGLDGAGTGSRFVAWKVRDVPEHVPTLDEPSVRDQVLKAWKHQHALPLARQRAEQLAELLRQSAENHEQALAGQTVTGASEGAAVSLAESPEFSWYRELSAPMASNRLSPVELGNPIVVNKPGVKFMEYVFETLKEGDVGFVMNDDATVCYVVRVVSRRAAQRESFKSAPLFGMSSPYRALAQLDEDRVRRAFQEALFNRYAVKWKSTRGIDEPASEAE